MALTPYIGTLHFGHIGSVNSPTVNFGVFSVIIFSPIVADERLRMADKHWREIACHCHIDTNAVSM